MSRMSFSGIRIAIDMAIVVIVLMSLNFTEISGLRGNVVETIGKSRHKIVHTIEVKATGQSQVSLLLVTF